MNRIKAELLSLVLPGVLCASVPQITDFSVAQDDASRKVTIDYRLTGEPAVVTVDVLTNGTSIGYANLRGFVGNVYYVLPVSPAGTSYTISWRPDKYWPAGGRITDGSVSFKLTAWSTNAPPEWLVADLFKTRLVYFYPSTELFPAGPEITNDVYKVDYLVMHKVNAAGKTFIMGKPMDTGTAAPQRTVSFTRDYYCSIFTYTVGNYYRVQGNASETLAADAAQRKPGVNVTYEEAIAYIESLKARLTGALTPAFTIPTAAQWEYLCRAGTTGNRYFPDEDANDYAWSKANAAGVIQEVGLLKPNAWLFYDTIGNVNEYTSDADGGLAFSAEPILDPVNPAASGAKHSVRGGAANEEALSSAYSTVAWNAKNFNVGFRVSWTLP